eukprot:m.274526 g.274526  ORF g.274526 m.274526 type:complete len:58 (+) comp11091_c1_seq8:44-217(+)
MPLPQLHTLTRICNARDGQIDQQQIFTRLAARLWRKEETVSSSPQPCPLLERIFILG